MSHSSQNIERLLERVSKMLPQTQRQNLPKTSGGNKHHESQQKQEIETNSTHFNQDLNGLQTPYTQTNLLFKDPIPKTQQFSDLDFLNENTFDLDQFERNVIYETEPTQTQSLNYSNYPIDMDIQNLKFKELNKKQNFLSFDKKIDHFPQLNHVQTTNRLKNESRKKKQKEKKRKRKRKEKKKKRKEKKRKEKKKKNYKKKKTKRKTTRTRLSKKKEFLQNSKKLRSYSLNNRLRKFNSPEKQEDSNLIQLRRSENEINQLLEKVKQTQNKISPKKEQKTIHSSQKQNFLNNQIYNLNYSLDSHTKNKNTISRDRNNYNNNGLYNDNNKIRRNTFNNNTELLKLLSKVKRIQTNNQINTGTEKNHNLNNEMDEFVLVSASNNKIKNNKYKKHKKLKIKNNNQNDFQHLLKNKKLNQKFSISEKNQDQEQEPEKQQQQQQQKQQQQEQQPMQKQNHHYQQQQYQKQKQKINQIEIFQLLNRAKQIRNKIQNTKETQTIPNNKPLKKIEIGIKNEEKEKEKEKKNLKYNLKNYRIEASKSKIKYNNKNENLKEFKDKDDDRNKFQNNNKNKKEEKEKEKEKEKKKKKKRKRKT